jgi:hypothetical protein
VIFCIDVFILFFSLVFTAESFYGKSCCNFADFVSLYKAIFEMRYTGGIDHPSADQNRGWDPWCEEYKKLSTTNRTNS